MGWDPEWEVNPKELKLIERIGKKGRMREGGVLGLTSSMTDLAGAQ
jgi:hypothetical protein